ncbi:MAG: hypothetical protein MR922_02785 [Lachnospiraceae bacterium]|nr:hypothetical protein [Lachnospiraceae bacterium]
MSKEPEEKADYSIRIDQCCSFKPSMDNTQGYKKADGQEVKESGNGGKEMMGIQ